jgi:hypothetical protein
MWDAKSRNSNWSALLRLARVSLSIPIAEVRISGEGRFGPAEDVFTAP